MAFQGNTSFRVNSYNEPCSLRLTSRNSCSPCSQRLATPKLRSAISASASQSIAKDWARPRRPPLLGAHGAHVVAPGETSGQEGAEIGRGDRGGEAAVLTAPRPGATCLLGGRKVQNVSSWRRTRPIDGQRCSVRFGLKMTHLRHWPCNAPIVSVPIEIPVLADAMLSPELRNRYAATRICHAIWRGTRSRGTATAWPVAAHPRPPTRSRKVGLLHPTNRP